jgi:hypothetical protein
MKKLSSYLTNYTTPSSGFSEGKLKDDPGDGTGSGIVVATHNDIMYGLLAIAKKWIGVISDTDESETASDILKSVERMSGVQNENVSEWANGTTYGQDAHVMYLGVQFVSMVAANTGNIPMNYPAKWMPCFNRDDAMVKWRNGEDIKGGFENVHNHRNAAYRQVFQWGKYNFGGDAGRNFQATGVHLDGTVVTGNAPLIALFDVGGVNQYHLLDVIAPDVVGVRTLMDSRGRVARIGDATAGVTAVVGAVQSDQMQGHWHNLYSGIAHPSSFANDSSIADPACLQNLTTLATMVKAAITDGTNGTPRTGSETRMMNYTTGIPAVIVMVEI